MMIKVLVKYEHAGAEQGGCYATEACKGNARIDLKASNTEISEIVG